MTDYFEKHYSIDPGLGKKMDGCPYSTFEDGHDVKDYIIPPKGYVFTGFRFDPDASNQIYDGKLIAEYEKETFNEKLESNLWKLILALGIVAVVAVIVILAAGVFKAPKSSHPAKETTTVVKTESPEPEAIQVAQEQADAPVATQEETPVEVKEEPVVETPQPVANTPTEQFKQEFWTLIHQRTIMMDPYHDLFVKYKGQADCEEFDYLRFTILKDSSSFKTWFAQLKKVPAADLESLQTVDELVRKLNETK